MKNLLKAVVPDILIAGGAAAVTYGAWTIYPPAGFIVGGVLALVVGLAAARKSD